TYPVLDMCVERGIAVSYGRLAWWQGRVTGFKCGWTAGPFVVRWVKSVCWILTQKSEKVYVKTSNPKMTYGRLVCWILTQKSEKVCVKTSNPKMTYVDCKK